MSFINNFHILEGLLWKRSIFLEKKDEIEEKVEEAIERPERIDEIVEELPEIKQIVEEIKRVVGSFFRSIVSPSTLCSWGRSTALGATLSMNPIKRPLPISFRADMTKTGNNS